MFLLHYLRYIMYYVFFIYKRLQNISNLIEILFIENNSKIEQHFEMKKSVPLRKL